MLLNLVFGITVMAVGLFLQAMLLLLALRYYRRRRGMIRNSSFAASLWVLGGVMLILVVGNLGQVALWALLFRALGEFPDFATAFYHSAVNLGTLGYGDIVMSPRYRLLGPLEAINGVLMIGISTAVLFATFQDAIQHTVEAWRSSGEGRG